MKTPLLSAILCAILLLPAVAFAAPDAFNLRMSKLENDIDKTRSEYAKYHPNAHAKSIDERLSEGISLQAAGDHQRAAYVFMDIVSHSEWRNHPGYQTAQLQLSKSLYEFGYYRICQNHLIDLIQSARGRERTDAIQLLLQVAQRTGDWDTVNLLLTQIDDFAQHRAYLYILGRAQFLQNDYDSARNTLNQLSQKDEWFVKGHYLLGVLDTIDGDYPNAMKHFDIVANSSISFQDSHQIHELAVLSRARLFYEQGLWSDALSQYQSIPESSPAFPTVLYEMGWTLLRQSAFQLAQQSFELLLLNYPNDPHAVETQQLLADIKRELGKYDDALAAYQNIVNEFEPVMTKMQQNAQSADSQKKDIKNKIENEQYKIPLLPENAKGLVNVGSDVHQIDQMLSALNTTNHNAADAELLVAEIQGILENENNIKHLPEFRHYTDRVRDIKINALMLGYEFTTQYDTISDSLPNDLSIISQIPRSDAEREIQSAYWHKARESREGELHGIKLKIQNMYRKMDIMQSWLDSGKIALKTDDEKRNILNQIDTLSQDLRNLELEQTHIATELAQIRNTSAIQNTYAAFAQSAQNMRSELEKLWSRALQNDSANEDYKALIQREQKLFSAIDDFDAQFQNGIAERTDELRARLAIEVERLNDEKSRFQSMKSDVGETAGEVTSKYIKIIYDQIHDIVLNADLGMVDIAWLLKDARSKSLSQTLDERKKERDVLEQDFKQFLKESGANE